MFVQKLATVREVIDWHVNRLGLANSSTHRERVRVLRLFCEQFGDERVDAIDPDSLSAFINGRQFKTWTRRRWCITVKTPFCCAVKAGRIPCNPFWSISVPQGDRGRDITRGEWQRLLRAASPYFRRVLVFLRFSGSRPGELRRLTWDMVRAEVQAAVLRIHKTTNTQKIKKPRRIALSRTTLRLLAWLKRNGCDSHLVFLNRDDSPWTMGAICCHLRRLRLRIGLPDDVKLYGCRHAFATGAIINGVDLATLAELLGHETTATTEHYIHLTGKSDHLTAAVEKATRRVL